MYEFEYCMFAYDDDVDDEYVDDEDDDDEFVKDDDDDEDDNDEFVDDDVEISIFFAVGFLKSSWVLT